MFEFSDELNRKSNKKNYLNKVGKQRPHSGYQSYNNINK